jgi:signal transduction histidine kinase
MRAWRKQEPLEEQVVQDVARAATAGASRAGLTKVALTYLLANTAADRIGVWMEAREAPAGWTNGVTNAHSRGPAAFRGLTGDRDGATTPAEWEILSPEAPLPADFLSAGKTVEHDIDVSPDFPILGALVGMQRTLWVPVENNGCLRGVLLAAMRRKNHAEPRRLLEQVAAELALALEWEDEHRRARERSEELSATKKLLTELARSGPGDGILERLVESCTKAAPDGGGIGAVFAVLRLWDVETEDAAVDRGTLGPRMWRSGDEVWSRAMESEPLAGILLRARDAHATIASVPGVRWFGNEMARILAIPLEAGSRTLGVLAAGFLNPAAAVAAAEGLELRASLAAAALHLRARNSAATQLAAQRELLLESCNGATILADVEGRIAGMSRGAREMLRDVVGDVRKVTAGGEQSAALRFAELFRTRDQQSVAHWLERALSCLTSSCADEELPEAELYDSTRVRLRCIVPSGRALAAITLSPVAAQDTARAEHAEAQLFNVIEWLEEGVVLFDADHGIRAMNSRFAQIAGLAPEETGNYVTLNGLIARLATQAAQPEHFAERWREQARGSDDVREEFQLLRPVPRVLERAARPIMDATGRRIGRVEIYRDLTAQRVFQSKLLQTEKLAALGQMVTGVAHELSNPLTTILGYAQRLLVSGDAVRPAEVQQIFQEAERASTIVRQLLMTARDSRPERRRVNLNQIIARALDLQRFSMAAEHVRVEQDLDPELPLVMGDAGQLQQVLMNLMGNSRQAVEQGGKGGTVRLRTKRTADGRALLEVSDDGPGIPDTILSRIFDPFFTTKPAGIGTGLGLAIVLGIVREHGGHVQRNQSVERRRYFRAGVSRRARRRAAVSSASGYRPCAARISARLPIASAAAVRSLCARAGRAGTRGLGGQPRADRGRRAHRGAPDRRRA